MTMKILLADENSQRAGALSAILKADPSLEVIRLEKYESLISAVMTHVPDIVLVDICRADRDGLDSVRALSSSGLERPIALFVDEDDEAFMEDAFAAGVCSYNVMDTPPRNVKPLLRSAIALYRRFQETTAELKAARQVLSDRETVDTAKKIFMRNERCGEAEAYRWLRRRAMQQARKMADVAADYLRVQTKDDAS